jgi:hypothetical protein
MAASGCGCLGVVPDARDRWVGPDLRRRRNRTRAGGPVLDHGRGGDLPFVSITRLQVRSWRYLPGFLIQSFRAARRAKLAAGNLAVSVLRDTDRAFWTRTVWRDEAAMRSFMRSGVHRRIMTRLAEWCDEAALAHWVQDANEPPSRAGGVSAPAARGPAFEGQSPIGGPTPVRDP